MVAWHEFSEVRLRNKQDELEALVGSQSYDITGISETWWKESCNGSAGMEGRRLFRSDRQGRWGGVALYVREKFAQPLQLVMMYQRFSG